jgi:hypothetical protein
VINFPDQISNWFGRFLPVTADSRQASRNRLRGE